VFRKPQALPLFAAMLGTGWQVLVIVAAAVCFAMLGALHGHVR